MKRRHFHGYSQGGTNKDYIPTTGPHGFDILHLLFEKRKGNARRGKKAVYRGGREYKNGKFIGPKIFNFKYN
jgi:hypothetical protein